MKRITSFLIILALSLVTIGCSQETTAPKNSDMQEQTVTTQEQSDASEDQFVTKTEGSSENTYDLKAIYEFVKGEYTYKDFEEFHYNTEVTMLDVTGEGTEEAILVYKYGDGPIIFLSEDNGKFEIIPTDVESGHYSPTEVSVDKEFVLIKGVTRGSGEGREYLNLAYYTGKEIKFVDSIDLKDYTAGSGNICSGEGYINFADDNNSYENFDYHYNLFVNEKHIQYIIKNYKFNKDTYTYDITAVDGGFDKLYEIFIK